VLANPGAAAPSKPSRARRAARRGSRRTVRTNGGTIEARSGTLYLRIKLAGERRMLRLAASTREQAEERRAVLAGMRPRPRRPTRAAGVELPREGRGGRRERASRRAAPRGGPSVRQGARGEPHELHGARGAHDQERGRGLVSRAPRAPLPGPHSSEAHGGRRSGALRLYVFPLVGDVPIKAFSLEHAESGHGRPAGDLGSGDDAAQRRGQASPSAARNGRVSLAAPRRQPAPSRLPPAARELEGEGVPLPGRGCAAPRVLRGAPRLAALLWLPRPRGDARRGSPRPDVGRRRLDPRRGAPRPSTRPTTRARGPSRPA
jgi:hypothetical protein